MRVKISTRAELDIQEIAVHYSAISLRVVEGFEADLKNAVLSLTRFWKYEYKYGLVRTYQLKSFPYKLHYKEYEEELVIEAVLHSAGIRRAE